MSDPAAFVWCQDVVKNTIDSPVTTLGQVVNLAQDQGTPAPFDIAWPAAYAWQYTAGCAFSEEEACVCLVCLRWDLVQENLKEPRD